MKSPIVLLRRLLEDFQRLNPDVKGLKRDLETLEFRFKHEGYGFLTIALSQLDDAILHGLSSRRFLTPRGLKKVRGGAIPVFLQGMAQEVFDPTTGTLKQNPNIGVLKDLHQILRLFKKTQLPDDEVEKLHKKAVEEFIQCDKEAGQVVIPDQISFHTGPCINLYTEDPLFKGSSRHKGQTRARCRGRKSPPESEVGSGGQIRFGRGNGPRVLRLRDIKSSESERSESRKRFCALRNGRRVPEKDLWLVASGLLD